MVVLGASGKSEMVFFSLYIFCGGSMQPVKHGRGSEAGPFETGLFFVVAFGEGKRFLKKILIVLGGAFGDPVPGVPGEKEKKGKN